MYCITAPSNHLSPVPAQTNRGTVQFHCMESVNERRRAALGNHSRRRFTQPRNCQYSTVSSSTCAIEGPKFSRSTDVYYDLSFYSAQLERKDGRASEQAPGSPAHAQPAASPAFSPPVLPCPVLSIPSLPIMTDDGGVVYGRERGGNAMYSKFH